MQKERRAKNRTSRPVQIKWSASPNEQSQAHELRIKLFALGSLPFALCPYGRPIVTFLCNAIASGLSGIDGDGAGRVLSGLAHVAALKKDSAQKNVRVN